MASVVKGALYLMLLNGCINNIEKENSDPDTETEGQDSSEEQINSDGESPTIISADAWCYRIEVGGLVETWKFIAEATDPQGTETLSTYIPGGVTFMSSDESEIDSVALICNEGECSTTVNATAFDAYCSEVDDYKVRFLITDENGNESEPRTIDTRLGADENG